MRVTCPRCSGSRVEKTDKTVPCTGCDGRGWIDDESTPVLPPPPAPDEPASGVRIQKPRRAEGWLLAVGLVILLALLGHVLNQQRIARQTPAIVGDGAQPDSGALPGPAQAPPNTEAPRSDATPRNDAGNAADTSKPQSPRMQVTYVVTHQHRLRDCHGKLTFTRERLRFESDEPEDSFEVGIDEVTIEGDVLRIRNRPWRFEFDDGTRVERVFSEWKAGTLRPVSAP